MIGIFKQYFLVKVCIFSLKPITFNKLQYSVNILICTGKSESSFDSLYGCVLELNPGYLQDMSIMPAVGLSDLNLRGENGI